MALRRCSSLFLIRLEGSAIPMVYTKEDAIRIVVSCAEKFHNELEGKSLLMILADKHNRTSYIEFSFYGYNYLHLTGLKVKRAFGASKELSVDNDIISANDFYRRCLNHKLSASDFEFSDDGTTALKLDILPNVISKNLSAKMVGDYDSPKPRLYTDKLAGGTNGCVGFVVDGNSYRYVPNTILKEDIRNCCSSLMRVISIYRKSINDHDYAEIVYMTKKINWEQITYPEEYSYLVLK